MLKITLFELFTAMIPEMILSVIGAYILNNKAFEWTKILVIALVTSFSTYLIRLLPIVPGVNIIFVMIMLSIGLIVISRFEVIKAVSSVLVFLIIRLITEWLHIVLLLKVFELNLDELTSNPVSKVLILFPAILVYALIIYIIYRFKKKEITR